LAGTVKPFLNNSKHFGISLFVISKRYDDNLLGFIPETVVGIYDYAFYGCAGLSSISIPKSVKVIRFCAFSESGLKEIHIEDGLTIIEDKAFESCEKLLTVRLPDSVTSLGGNVFNNCSSLYSANIPPKVTRFNYLFYSCNSLENVGSLNKVVSIGRFTFGFCSKLKEVEIPESVSTIEEFAFQGCESIETVVIPNSVSRIEEAAFIGCKKMAHVILPDSIKSIQRHTFAICVSLSTIIIPDKVVTICSNAFERCSKLSFVVIPKSVKYFDKDAFKECPNIKEFHVFSPFPPEHEGLEKFENGVLFVPKGCTENYSEWAQYFTAVEEDEPGFEQYIKDNRTLKFMSFIEKITALKTGLKLAFDSHAFSNS